MKKIQLIITALGIVVFFTMCRHQEAPVQEEVIPDKNTVSLTQGQIQLAQLEFGVIEKRLLSGDVNARGKIVLPPSNDAIISPVMRGIVKEIKVMQGDIVKKGTVLAYLAHPEFIILQEDYIQTKMRIAYLENEYNRQRKLYEEKVSSEKKFLETKTEYESAVTRLMSLGLILGQTGMDIKKIESDGIQQLMPVASPMDGIVDAVLTNIGKNVTEDESLFEVVCRKRLFVELSVFERDILKIKLGQRVTFKLSNIDSQEYEAHTIAIGGSVQEPGRVVKVLAEFENPDERILPGMFVASEIHTGEQALDALPVSAIMDYGSKLPYIFYTSTEPEAPIISFGKMLVKTGYVEKGFVQVTLADELPPNVRIVTVGGYYVGAEAAKGAE